MRSAQFGRTSTRGSCAAARFLVFTPQMGGLGSMVHNHGAVLVGSTLTLT